MGALLSAHWDYKAFSEIKICFCVFPATTTTTTATLVRVLVFRHLIECNIFAVLSKKQLSTFVVPWNTKTVTSFLLGLQNLPLPPKLMTPLTTDTAQEDPRSCYLAGFLSHVQEQIQRYNGTNRKLSPLLLFAAVCLTQCLKYQWVRKECLFIDAFPYAACICCSE